MKNLATTFAETDNLFDIRRLVSEGEGSNLEFKRKTTHPEKIIREFIAFANTAGGTVLIGVDDDGSIPGLKYPEEDIHVLTEAMIQYCRPLLVYQESILPISENRFVIRCDIPPSERLHFLVLNKQRETFVRTHDMSIKASAEMQEILKRSKKHRNVRFTFGEAEKKLMVYLEANPHISLAQYMKLSCLNRFRARRKLILLVLASVLKISATEKGDLYSRL